MLHVFIGDDDYTIRRAVEQVKKTIDDPTALMTNTTVLDGKQTTPAELQAACETVPFLSEKRMVIAENLLERFDAGTRTGRKKSSKKDDGPEPWKVFADILKKLPDFTELIVIGGVVKGTNPLLKELMPTGRVKSFPRLKSPELKTWVNRRITEQGGAIGPKALDTLVKFVGNDLWLMSAEVEKLVLYRGTKEIRDEDVRMMVSATQEANVFTMVDAILESRTATAQALFHRLLADGNYPAQLLVMISRQVRILYQIKSLRQFKRQRNDIRVALGNPADFVFNKAWAQADKYSLERLKEIYHRLLDTDIGIKTGKFDGELALSILIGEMGLNGTGAKSR